MPKVTFIEPNGKARELEAAVGDCLLDIAQANNIDVSLAGRKKHSIACQLRKTHLRQRYP